MSESDEDIIRDMEKSIEEGTELEGYKPVPVRTAKTMSVSFAVRLTADEHKQFAEAAEAHGMTLSDFIRSSLYAAVAGELDVESAAAVRKARDQAQALAETLSRF